MAGTPPRVTHNTHLRIATTGILGNHHLHLQTADTLFTIHDLFRGAHNWLHQLENEVRPESVSKLLSRATGDLPTYRLRLDTLGNEEGNFTPSPEPHVLAEALYDAMLSSLKQFGYLPPASSSMIGTREIPELAGWWKLSPFHRTTLANAATQFLQDIYPLLHIEEPSTHSPLWTSPNTSENTD